MKKLILLILLATAASCDQTIDPFDKPFSCILNSKIEGSATSGFAYNDKGVLTSRSRSDAGTIDSRTFVYDGTGRVTQINGTVSGSSSYTYAFKFTYGSDGRVSQYTYAVNGTNAGVNVYTRSGNTVKESYTPTGWTVPSYTDEFTYSGNNIIKEVYKEFNGPNKAQSFNWTRDQSNFDSAVSSEYVYFSRVSGVPFPYSHNNPAKAKLVYYNIANGVNQASTTIDYSYTYTYNKSNAVLTAKYSYVNGSSTGTATSETNSYKGCE